MFFNLSPIICGNVFPVRQLKSQIRRPLISLAATITLLSLAVVVPAQRKELVEADLVHFGDLVDVDVLGGFEFDWRGKLTPEGFLDGLNSYGDPIFGLCRSESEIASDITKAYSKFLRDPKIVVRILDRSDRAAVTLDGAVRLPQRFQLRRAADLRELLVLSGGITDEAGGEIQIFRPRNMNCLDRIRSDNSAIGSGGDEPKSNVPQFTTIKIADLLKGLPSANPVIQSGDLITVLRAVPIYVIGGVNDPRQISAREGMTLSRAVASAGGLAKDADGSQVTIFRREGSVADRIEADLGKIAAGAATDPLLKAFDIVEVRQTGKEKRKYAPVVSGIRPTAPNGLPLSIVE